MENELFHGYEDFGLPFTSLEFAFILTSVVLIRLIPVLIFISAILKYRRFPALRPLHVSLALSSGLLIALFAVNAYGPAALRTAAFWPFLGLFAIVWLTLTWTRSAFRTGLRPRILDIATLTLTAAIVAALLIPLSGAV